MNRKNKHEAKFVLHHTKQKKNNNTYTYHQIAWYYRENKKPIRDIIKHLGVLNKNEIDYYKKSIGCLNHEDKYYPCDLNELSLEEPKDYLSCAVVLHFWEYWNLSSVFPSDKSQKEVSTNDMAGILTSLRFVQTCSKSFSAKLYKDTTLPELTGVSCEKYNKSRIFRELENIEKYREEIGKHIFKQALNKGDTKGKVLFYGLSSANVTGLRCVMAKWGHCKDGYLTHVVLLLVITPEGYPIYWEILEGNTSDSKTIEGFINKVENIYGKIDSILCFDRGMVSDKNLKYLQDKGIKFITALDGSQLNYFDTAIDKCLFDIVKKFDLKKETKQIHESLSLSGFIYAKENLYHKEIILTKEQEKKIEKETDKLDLSKRRYYLAFNPELAYLTHKHRIERVEAFKEWVEEYNKDLAAVLQNKRKETIEKAIKAEKRRRKIADVNIDYTLENYTAENVNIRGKNKVCQTYRIKLNSDEKKAYLKAMEYDGLWVLITNIMKEYDEEIKKKTGFNHYFDVYRMKTNIEEAFRILSDFVDVEPFYVYLNEHIKAHFTICVLAYLINITILNKIRKSMETDNMDLHNIFFHLRKCRQHKVYIDKNKSITKLTTCTNKQKEILNSLNCSYLIENKHLCNKNIINIC
ncbi:MAG: IS1634 family transposase [Bacteroidia bacterium]|nr:IS1634 family transposase [Bacteroidia bacterium]